ncbi:hypothetical protein SLE2022_096670 [Rubroshorea leprosula]
MSEKKRRETEVVKAPKRARAEDNGREAAVTDEEVEEFFRTLKRIHVAVSYFKERNADWRHAAESPGNSVKRREEEKESTEETAGPELDLNVDPII